jgi:hypothetical protein
MIDAEMIDQALRTATADMKDRMARGITDDDVLMHGSVTTFLMTLTLKTGDPTAMDIMKALFHYAGQRGRPT